jgi:hypothetical protein
MQPKSKVILTTAVVVALFWIVTASPVFLRHGHLHENYSGATRLVSARRENSAEFGHGQ